MTAFLRLPRNRFRLAVSVAAGLCSGFANDSMAQIQVPALRYGTRPTLQPNRVGSFAARPFEYGRIARFSTRTGCNDCGIPPGEYDRETPVRGDSAISFYPPITEFATRRPATPAVTPVVAEPAIPPAPPDAATIALDNSQEIPSRIFQADDSILSKQFRLQARRLQSKSFVLENPAVYVTRDGLAIASGKLYQTGGPTGTDRGGRVRIEVRGYGSALAFGSANFSQSQLPDDAVVLWSYATEQWVPRGGPTSATILNTSVDDVGRPGIQSTFSRLTHVEVMITPRTVR